MLAYLLLKEGLRQEYGLTDNPIFEYNEHGKPSIVGHPEIHFNLSHCKEAAICAVSNKPIGVDIESSQELKDSLVNYTMNDDEKAEIAGSHNPAATFIRLWTMKEAVLKLSGHGLTDNLKPVLSQFSGKLQTIAHPDLRYVYSIADE